MKRTAWLKNAYVQHLHAAFFLLKFKETDVGINYGTRMRADQDLLLIML